MSKLNPLYEKGDVKFFWHEHIKRMQLTSQPCVSYRTFYGRLKNGMSLRDAIYKPSNTKMNRYNMKPKNRREEFKKATYKMISFLSLVMRGKIKPKTE